MAKESLSRYAPAPWGMQPNTSPAALSPQFPWAAFHSCLYIYCILYHFWDVRRILLPPPRQIRRDLSTTFSTSIAKQPISTSPTLQHSPLRFSKDGSSLLRKSIFLQARSRLVGYCIFKYAIRKQYIKNRFFEFSSVCSTFFAHQFQCRTRNSTTRRNSFKNRFNRLALRT